MYVQEKIRDKVDRFMDVSQKNMGDALGIKFLSFKEDEVKGSMPVNENTVQPFGILHGGASVALAETLASIGAWLHAGESETAVGVEINANHIRAIKKGEKVIGTAVPVKTGRKVHVWEVKIHTEEGKLVCVSRCTLMIISRES
ncbi:PaaI family thioesterase [Balneolaceae bacterium YR4-1]|uniref:PaaI family thioesterase n=1 Tax=Halalkalibaculum roseum TaxID=2709311 RepID=A0A6M1SXK7_9BACT|nr:PaaI family thioesterase [Halalkalibaculum roseum]NGP75864.1 PaaI family thioesterase [Halalkalibaculum roseum]